MNYIKDYLSLQTCSLGRLKKIENILLKSQEFVCVNLNKLNKIHVSKFLRKINNSDFTEWTKNDYKKIFKSFLKCKYKSEFLDWTEDKSIVDGFKCLSKKKAFNKKKINKETLIKPEELESLLRNAKSLKWKALLTLLYESAFRPCELVNLRWEDLKFDDFKNSCSIRTISPKTKDLRIIPVVDCVVHLKRWREEFEFSSRKETDFVFPNPQDRSKHLNESGLSHLIKRICSVASIRPLFPYMFRHTRIYFIQKKLGPRFASKFAGHSLDTSEIYDHLDNEDLEEVMFEKIYTTKELTVEDKNKLVELEKEVKELRSNYIQVKELLKKNILVTKKTLLNVDSTLK